jgi:hypothetical protein
VRCMDNINSHSANLHKVKVAAQRTNAIKNELRSLRKPMTCARALGECDIDNDNDFSRIAAGQNKSSVV